MDKLRNNKKILIADDDDAIRCLLCHALSDGGYSCNCVSSGRDLYNLALSSSSGQDYSLIIADVNMPDWDGVEGLQMAKCFGAARCPCIIISGTNTADIMEEVEKMRYVFFCKPFRMTDLLDKVIELIGEA